MALSPQLLQFKSSGVYRLEFDKSQTTNFATETIRLVVGHSKKGPYNTPVFIQTVEDFNTIFGGIDRNLEKKGMFFHRSALTTLTRGPILALNLASFDSGDTINFASPSTNGSSVTAVSDSGTDEYTKFFNTDKFWFPSDEAVIDTIGTDNNRLLNLINIKQEPITVIVRKAQDVASFDVTAREWYGEGNVPAFLNDKDYLSDFMVDVFVFKGEFDPATLVTDPVYKDYFTAQGLIKTQLDAFSNLRQVSLIASYTGSLIPNFKDLEGRNLYVETMINSEARRTGLFCAIDEDNVQEETGTNVDLVGHTFDADQNYEVLSYIIDQTLNPSAGTTITLNGALVFAGAATTTVSGSTLTAPHDISASISVGDFLKSATLGPNGTVEYVEVTSVVVVAGNGVNTNTVTTVTCEGAISSTLNGVASFKKFTITNSRVVDYALSETNLAGNGSVSGTYANLGAGIFTITYAAAISTVTLKKGQYVPSAIAGRLAKIKSVSKAVVGLNTVVTITTDANLSNTWGGQYVVSFEEATSVYKPFILGKATIGDKSITNALTALSGTNLFNALADKDLILYRYVVDTFGSYDTVEGLQNKKELSFLAHQRQNVSAILNAPTIADFKKSTNPSFTDENGSFDTIYLKDGGNLDKNPTAFYTLPSINDGANYAFYYGPGLTIRENGKDIVVPPAAYVSNNYIDKYSTALPWSIVAGSRRGVISGTGVVGVEYAFDKTDRDVLEPFGINPIVFQRGVGLTVLGNKTGQQSVKSALSSAHVREVLIYIQEGMANILKGYVFEFNTAQTRLEIKTLADAFMESVKADQGVYDFKNVIDQTNNTNEVIDNNIGILDTFVEPVKGLEIVVHRTTVLNTGEISTGNFS
jgi:hypothetical protein